MAMGPISPFWMVCRAPTHPNARTEPKARFPTLVAARMSAQELADANDAAFVVLASVETVRPRGAQAKLI